MEVGDDFFAELAPAPQTLTKKDAVINRIQDGKVVPILGNALTNELAFGSHGALIRGWARYAQYPMIDQNHDLARMAQYASVSQASDGSGDEMVIKERYIDFLKAALQLRAKRDQRVSADQRAEIADEERTLTVSQMAHRLRYPHPDSPQENPLLVLAALPLPIYITTCYHDFLEVALREKARKDPQTEVYRWHPSLDNIPSIFELNQDYEPTPERPLVFHLHGFDKYPASLVLTEDDYLDFLTNIFRHGRTLPTRVRRALTDSSLVMIGYHPTDWDFRTVFRGIIKPRPPSAMKDSVAIQVDVADQYLQDYLEKYMRQVRFEIEWSNPAPFILDIYQKWQTK